MAREPSGPALLRDINATHTGWPRNSTRKGVLACELSTLFYLFTVRNGKNGALDVHLAQITHVHPL
jgi:hypothetical protein